MDERGQPDGAELRKSGKSLANRWISFYNWSIWAKKLSLPRWSVPVAVKTEKLRRWLGDSCGARQVGPPLAQPDHLLPKLGPAMIAIGCAVLVLVIFLAAWIFSNDSKVGRAILVTMIGDGTKLTRSAACRRSEAPLSSNLRLRRLPASLLSLPSALIPLSLFGIWQARHVRRMISSAPARFGGARMARTSLILCSLWLLVLTTVTALNIPGAIERGRAKRRAATARRCTIFIRRDSTSSMMNMEATRRN
jgi:hypothetical protein